MSTNTKAQSKRIAAIDWMRGFVMILMVLDHVSMVYDVGHLSTDSAASYEPGTALPEFAFFSRWITHLCAPTFVFLAGTALAISVERKLQKGVSPALIDKDILLRGLFIAALDLTLVSLVAGKWTVQVLYAIGVAMMCMAFFRRLSTPALIVIALGWMLAGEALTALFWPPGQGAESIGAALLFSKYSSDNLSISYALLPWLAVMLLGWVFGRFILDFNAGKTRLSPAQLLYLLGFIALAAFALVRYVNGYGNMFLLRDDMSWQHWLHVSKYPPSLSFMLLELGLMSIILAMMMNLEKIIGVRPNGVLLVFGQTAMMYYLVHRLLLVGSGNYLGLKDFTDLGTSYWITLALLLLLYPFCLWYRGFKARHSDNALLKYL
ncbi:DUF1624 domain-containing protein [Agaribacterium haliotis]|uniref:DUF1624 domain-containing protein n=1 Tax=Agaribacterium haliotis TaxID=2013869 RepID=UPI000BB54BB1|nr:heparan-alpha-glucosaminide N-acetyltransferase domain-containing protein [Agaribacterium haliotis]